MGFFKAFLGSAILFKVGLGEFFVVSDLGICIIELDFFFGKFIVKFLEASVFNSLYDGWCFDDWASGHGVSCFGASLGVGSGIVMSRFDIVIGVFKGLLGGSSANSIFFRGNWVSVG